MEEASGHGTGLADPRGGSPPCTFLPLMGDLAACGFPSPADDYLDRPLDFNELIIENAAATFAVRVAGESMTGAGIFPGDIAVVNRGRNVTDRCIVLALADGEFTIKRYRARRGRVWLEAENPAFADIEISEGTDFEVWGVITRCVRLPNPRPDRQNQSPRKAGALARSGLSLG